MIYNSHVHALPEADCGYEYVAIKTKDGTVYWTDDIDPMHIELLEILLDDGVITPKQYDSCGVVIYNDFSPRHNRYTEEWVMKKLKEQEQPIPDGWEEK